MRIPWKILALVTVLSIAIGLGGVCSLAAQTSSQSATLTLQMVIPDSIAIRTTSQLVLSNENGIRESSATLHTVWMEWLLPAGDSIRIQPTLRTSQGDFALLANPGFLSMQQLETAAAIRAFNPSRPYSVSLLAALTNPAKTPRGQAALFFESQESDRSETTVLTLSVAAF